MPLKPFLPAAVSAVAALVVALLAVNTLFAASGTLQVTSATVTVGEQVTVAVIANVEEPGLGAWTLDVQYDPMALNILGCEPFAGSVCSTSFDDDLARVTGASAAGNVGETTIGTLTFECNGPGISSIDLIISVFADATDGDPQDIDPLSVVSGAIACVEEAEPTATAAATEPMPTAAATSTAVATPTTVTTAPAVLPDTGSGPASGNAIGWLAVALATAGLAFIAGFGALRALGGAGGGR